MAITVNCAINGPQCEGELEEPGALIFSPPDLGGQLRKFHVCSECWPIVALLTRTPAAEPEPLVHNWQGITLGGPITFRADPLPAAADPVVLYGTDPVVHTEAEAAVANPNGHDPEDQDEPMLDAGTERFMPLTVDLGQAATSFIVTPPEGTIVSEGGQLHVTQQTSPFVRLARSLANGGSIGGSPY